MNRVVSNYLKRVSDVAKSGFSSEEERESCVDNVFAELEEDGIPLCCGSETSVIVEQFVSMANENNLNTLFEVMNTDLSTVLTNKYASHVLESTLVRSTYLICGYVQNFQSETTEESSENSSDSAKDSLINHVLDLSKSVQEDIQSHITNSYSSHVLRILLQVLGGANVESKLSRQKKGPHNEQKKAATFTDYGIPKVFTKNLKETAKHIFALTQINNLILDTHACAVIQVLLLVLNKVDTEICQKYIKKIIKLTKINDEDPSDKTRLPPVMTDKVGSYLIQQVITLCTPDMYRKLYTKLFKGQMLVYAIHPKANFVLQSLINSCPEKELFRDQSGELESNFEDILAYGHYGVIVAIAKACQKMECKQKAFRQSLMTAFHCRDPKSRQKKLFRLTLMMKTFEVYYNLLDQEVKGGENTEPDTEDKNIPDVYLMEADINYSGSLIIQEMLKFTGIQLTEEGLLDLSADDICALSRNSFGCYVIESIFQSSKVSATAKNHIMQILKEKCVDIACHRIGCQCIQSVWMHLNLAEKKLMAAELCIGENKVRNDQYGKFVFFKLDLQHFSKRQSDWELAQAQEARKRKLFSNMLGNEMLSKRMKKGKDSQDRDAAFEPKEQYQVTNVYDDQESDRSISRGRGHRGQFRGGQRGRGGHRDNRDNRGRGRGNFRGGGRGYSRGRGFDRESGSDSFRKGNWRGRGDFRRKDNFRGQTTGGKSHGAQRDHEERKSASFGGTGQGD